ncbi:MAG: pyridoxamine 5'-phosphate oxidase family protein [Aigarchaeota archaeon]|nr:pyridoxamine 5'-phosphate oxidase family protein [Candidatus Pelearchaeum maunauluense]
MCAVKFTEKELKFIQSLDLCRLATVYPDCRPHVVPVNYVFLEGKFYIGVDYESRKVRNIQKNNKVALVIDVYKPNRGILIEGEAALIDRGPEFKRVYSIFYERFIWVTRDPWDEGEAPFIVVTPLKKVSWGIK